MKKQSMSNVEIRSTKGEMYADPISTMKSRTGVFMETYKPIYATQRWNLERVGYTQT